MQALSIAGHVAFFMCSRDPPGGGQFENIHLATRPVPLFGWFGFILSTHGSQGLGPEAALRMKEETFPPTGCASPPTETNERTVNAYSKTSR